MIIKSKRAPLLMKVFALAALLAFSGAGPPARAEAGGYETPATLRIGLLDKYSGVSAVAIGNASIQAGYSVNGVFMGEVMLNSNAGFTAAPSSKYYISSGAFYGSYEQAASGAGDGMVAGYNGPGSWELLSGGYATAADAENARARTGGAVVSPNGRQTLLTGGYVPVLYNSPDLFGQIADANGGTITLGDKKYRGVLEFYRDAKGITAVNIIGMDDYLMSAVPSEMPPAWHIEALKAQAVAARCYTATRMGVHSQAGCDLCDLTHCQAYLGQTNEVESTNRAVYETAGVYAYYDGKPINATFFSSSGGVTEHGEMVWSNPAPYLQSVAEVAETEFKQWTRTFTLNEITDLLNKSNANIGTAVTVSVSSASPSGRVTDLTIKGTNGSKTFSKGEVRSFFTGSAGGMLESTNFVIQGGADAGAVAQSGAASATGTTMYVMSGYAPGPAAVSAGELIALAWESPAGVRLAPGFSIIDASRTSTAPSAAPIASAVTESSGTTVTFTGKGWGHGAGMSQFGAKGMAEAGYTYDQILKHYYTGIQLTEK